ncbi:Acyltransferase family protein [Streptomyces sp. ADI97-07]|uniref:acyltransferase family protein n=1 Tax=Streptomyces sp. ADI97-07 TaxID=1522762 RepID=UPI000F554CB3|nr:acyltransferase [Streptomyces sp. ADI97-07]RPK77237.1 Acyltransferase family protein [Streptomyces sp. ADI97-07]
MTYPNQPRQDGHDGTRPPQGGARPPHDGARPPYDGTWMPEIGALPGRGSAYPEQDGTYAGRTGAPPAQDGPPPVRENAAAGRGGPYPAYAGTLPGQTRTAPDTAAGTTAPPAAPEAPVPPARPGRDRYLDLLRAVALVRVVFFHLFGWAWLTVLFPSMGVMFALAGSLMARSLARPAGGVIRGRLRRLLPPMWAFSLLVVPVMFALSWKPVREEGLWWFVKIGCYLFPIGSPPYPEESGSTGGWLELTWADQAVGPLWYIRAYLWFVLASPLLLRAFRRLPWVTLLAPIGLTAVIGTGLVTVDGMLGDGLVDFAVFGSCWILGFAHNDGLLKEIPRYLAVSSAAIVMGFGLWWASGHLTEEGWNLDEIPLAQATWSLGFCAILLIYAPSWQKLPGKLAGWDGLITLANNRAVTIYLWHNLLLMAAAQLVDELWTIPWFGDAFGSYIEKSYDALVLIAIWPLIGLAILAFGWVEDTAAKRRPRLWPNGADRRGKRA